MALLEANPTCETSPNAMCHRILILFALLLGAWRLGAQCQATFRGRILEEETGEPVGFAYILVEEVSKATQADEEGYFVIPRLCKDRTYTIDISLVGYQRLTRKFSFSSEKIGTFKIKSGPPITEVVILEHAVLPPKTPVEIKVEGQDYHASMGAGWSEMLYRIPGVSQVGTGPTIAKPVIQGLHSSRVALVNNNVIHETQAWGEDHAPELDPATAGALTLVKGAAGVRYGIGAIGGALLLEPAPLRHKPGMGGWVAASGATNGQRISLAGSLDWFVPRNQWGTRVSYSRRRTGNLRTPNYYLDNTGAKEDNLFLLTGWRRNRWSNEIAASMTDQHYGMLRSAYIGNLSDLQLALGSDVPINNEDIFTKKISRPRQWVKHYMGKYRGTYNFGDNWKLSGQYSIQYNDRAEYDEDAPFVDPKDDLKSPQLAMGLLTNHLDIAAEHFSVRDLKGGMGVHVFHQNNTVSQGSFIPDYQSFGFAFWMLEHWRRPDSRWDFEMGLRNDFRRTHVRNIYGLREIDRTLTFNNVSAAVGLDYQFSQNFQASLHSGYAWRPPSMIELYALGVHYSAATFEEGDPNLTSEKALNTNLTLQWHNTNFNWYVNFYRNQIWDYIYLNPRNKLIQTIRGAYLAYHFTQNDAVIQGLDAAIDINPINRVTFSGKVSLLEGFRTDQDNGPGLSIDWLPLMPSSRVLLEGRWSFGKTIENKPAASGWGSRSKAMRRKTYDTDSYLRIGTSITYRQKRIPSEGLLQDPPATYGLLNADVAHVIYFNRTKLYFGASGRNLTNRRYRNYLNFFRYFADEPGTNVSLWTRLVF